MNILILAAGQDQVTQEDGYPLCLVEFDSVPLIQRVADACRALDPRKMIVAFREEDVYKYHLDNILGLLSPRARVLRIGAPTAGAACTALLAAEDIDTDDELLIVNGNELLQADFKEIVNSFRKRGLGAGVVVFPSIHPRYSYVRLDDKKLVVEASEKNPISNHATVGFYWFAKGRYFVRAAKNAIRKDARVNGKFYICPTFNELVLEQLDIGVFEIESRSYKPLKSGRQIEQFDATIETGPRI
jgi:NDP-sugar pyrophosphorylase family protein